ncbi:MAG: conjugal transfer protein TraL [Acidobacteria bacterium]|nr:MAG: conjugal transfer protein TraL [Acidobacteriota bacterium]
MAKDNSNTNGDDSTLEVHLVLNGKGGVGKSVVATWLAEFLVSRGRSVRCIDGDPVNRSFSQYKALGAEKLDLVNDDGLIQRARYDALIERFATTSGVFVVDCGATAFLPFWGYMVESQVVRVLREAGRTVYLHVPITGGETLGDTLLGFSAVAAASTEIWLNEYFGQVVRDGRRLTEMQVYTDNQDKVLASIGIRERSPDTYGETVGAMRLKKLTFEEAISSPEFKLVEKSRLHIVRRDLFEQLERTPFA